MATRAHKHDRQPLPYLLKIALFALCIASTATMLHTNVTTITQFAQNCSKLPCLDCVASLHVATMWPYSQVSFAVLYPEMQAFYNAKLAGHRRCTSV